MLFSKLKSASAVFLLVAMVGIGVSSVIADGRGDWGHSGYKPDFRGAGSPAPGDGSSVVIDIATQPGEVALDANAGKNNPYFRQADPTNINHLWELCKTGEYYMLLPKVRRIISGEK